MRRRIKVLILAGSLVVAAAAYSGAWFYLAGVLKARADGYITRLTGDNIKAACINLDVSGYPLEIGVHCDGIRANDRGNSAQVEAGAFRAEAQIDRPGHIVSTLSGPLHATAPDGSTIAADWIMLRSSTVVWTEGLLRGNVQARQIKATIDSARIPGGPFHIESPELEAHTRQQKTNLDATFTVDKLAVSGSGLLANLPTADISASATLNGMAQFLSGKGDVSVHMLRGRSGRLRSLIAKLGNGASFTLSGPFSFDAAGKLSGTFKVKVVNISAWQQAIEDAFPGMQQAISTASGMLTALANKDGSATLTLTADHGHLSFGLIPIGELPPI